MKASSFFRTSAIFDTIEIIRDSSPAKTVHVLIEKRGKCLWMDLRVDTAGKAIVPAGWAIVRTREAL